MEYYEPHLLTEAMNILFNLPEKTVYCTSFTEFTTDFKLLIRDRNQNRILPASATSIHFYTVGTKLDEMIYMKLSFVLSENIVVFIYFRIARPH